ncbi:MAG: hypothetical protein H0U74_06940 [Bradymonadaceae bacterium]|nr:hypothetical protein [Lujinxingiaceae bacterium]
MAPIILDCPGLLGAQQKTEVRRYSSGEPANASNNKKQPHARGDVLKWSTQAKHSTKGGNIFCENFCKFPAPLAMVALPAQNSYTARHAPSGRTHGKSDQEHRVAEFGSWSGR